MARLLASLAALVLLAACAAQLPQTPPAGTAAEVRAPEVRPGSFWHYAVSDGFTRLPRGTLEYRVDNVHPDSLAVEVVGGGANVGTELYTRDWNWLRRPATNMQVFEYAPAYRAFDFPLLAGKHWSFRGTATDPADHRRFPVRIEADVLGWERVRVPAGEFDALKVQRRVILDYWLQGVRGQSLIVETDWYAPALGQVARRETTSRYLRLAQSVPSFVPVRGGGGRGRDGEVLPRYEQDDWLVYELVKYGPR